MEKKQVLLSSTLKGELSPSPFKVKSYYEAFVLAIF
jgi:hypothetical protein